MDDHMSDSDRINRQDDSVSLPKSGELSPGSDLESLGEVFQGFVFHVGVNSVGRQFCHLRYMRIRGKYIQMFKRDPNLFPGEEPIRQGVAGQFLIVEELGRQKILDRELYVLKISSRVDGKRMGEIACVTAEDARNWKTAFQQAKDEAEADLRVGNGHLLDGTEFKLDGHRRRVRRYARGFTKLITIGAGPEAWIRKDAKVKAESGSGAYAQIDGDDTVEQHEWRCISAANGIRILENVTEYKVDKTVIMKSVAVVEATPSAVFEMLMNVGDGRRKEWDILTGDLELIERIDGHRDIVYGTFDPKYLQRWHSKRDFVFSRYWRSDADGSYSIIQIATSHKDCPPRSGYHRIKLNPTSWEIRPLKRNIAGVSRSLVTQTMEMISTGWGTWKRKYYPKFHKTIPYVLLCQIAGLRDFFAANPNIGQEASVTTVPKKIDKSSDSDVQAKENPEEFYDAIAAVPGEDDDDSDEEESEPKKASRHKLRSITWSLALCLSSKRPPAREENCELELSSPSVDINADEFKGSLRPAVSSNDTNCWADPGGKGFMVRGKTYMKDSLKVPGGDPLLKLLAVDWFCSEHRIDLVATHPNYLVQSEAGKKLPFILVINLQVPGNPNYSMIFYFGAEKPIRKGSLLDRFVNGDDIFRDSRFKLIPSIVEGYWVVKRAVGTKACLLGKAVTCTYHRQDNFLEIDVDIGSSSVARSVVNIALGYVTSIVVDLAILIEAREEHTLPEYLLGTVRINRVRTESVVPFEQTLRLPGR